MANKIEGNSKNFKPRINLNHHICPLGPGWFWISLIAFGEKFYRGYKKYYGYV